MKSRLSSRLDCQLMVVSSLLYTVVFTPNWMQTKVCTQHPVCLKYLSHFSLIQVGNDMHVMPKNVLGILTLYSNVDII
jgi:hypothetical protein